jgi:hypothetical protein
LDTLASPAHIRTLTNIALQPTGTGDVIRLRRGNRDRAANIAAGNGFERADAEMIGRVH